MLQKQLAADPHNAELTDKIAHCTAVIDAMDAYNMDTQIKKVLNGMGFPADTWTKLAGVLSGVSRPGCVWHGCCWSAPTC